MGYLINSKGGDEHFEHLRHKMSEHLRRSARMRNAGGSPGAMYKNEQETEEAYCKGYEHGYEDAMKQLQNGEHMTSEFKYGM